MRIAGLAALVFTSLASAQQGKQPPQPPLMQCGTHGDIDIVCGTHSPEDLDLTPDGKYLIVSQYSNGRAPMPDKGLVLFDPAKKTFARMSITSEPLKDWGDASCPGDPGDALAPHGTSVSKRTNGKNQLFVVNHGGRQSIEMYEVKQTAGTWGLIWHGCAVSMQEFNDVAALPSGGFVATHPVALQQQGSDIFAGQPSGYVVQWDAGKGESELPGSRAGYPNGVISKDGRYAYFNAWTVREVHKYDIKEGKETGVVKLDFMPDNLTWTKKGQMLAAGVKGVRGDCPAGSGVPCGQGFGIAEIDPATMKATTVFDSQGKGALIAGVSVALQVGDSIYIGAFNGDRIVKIGWKQ